MNEMMDDNEDVVGLCNSSTGATHVSEEQSPMEGEEVNKKQRNTNTFCIFHCCIFQFLLLLIFLNSFYFFQNKNGMLLAIKVIEPIGGYVLGLR